MHESRDEKSPHESIKTFGEIAVKKRSLIIIAAAALVVLAALAAYAYTNQAGAANKNCAANCSNFTDANRDGVCDMAAKCHKDGKCDPAKCDRTKCDPAKCHPNQGTAGCPGRAGGGCPGHR
jgi:hypothetical protein